jgi:hypothetical protein
VSTEGRFFEGNFRKYQAKPLRRKEKKEKKRRRRKGFKEFLFFFPSSFFFSLRLSGFA